MSARSILARTFFALSVLTAAYAATVATATPAHAGDMELSTCPNSVCRDGSQLCCSHVDGSNTFYYYKN